MFPMLYFTSPWLFWNYPFEFLNSFTNFYWLILERKRGRGRHRKKKREREISLLLHSFLHSLIHSCMCPERRWNPQPSWIGTTLYPTELPGQGHSLHIFHPIPWTPLPPGNHKFVLYIYRSVSVLLWFILFFRFHKNEIYLFELYYSIIRNFILISHRSEFRYKSTLSLVCSFTILFWHKKWHIHRLFIIM